MKKYCSKNGFVEQDVTTLVDQLKRVLKKPTMVISPMVGQNQLRKLSGEIPEIADAYMGPFTLSNPGFAYAMQNAKTIFLSPDQASRGIDYRRWHNILLFDCHFKFPGDPYRPTIPADHCLLKAMNQLELPNLYLINCTGYLDLHKRESVFSTL